MVAKILKSYEPPLNSRHQKGDMKDVCYLGHSIIIRHSTKCSRYDDLDSGTCASLI